MNRGPISLFARHPTAANLLMGLIVLLGVFALNRMNIQFFPDFGIDVVTVEVEWPGASAEDVDTTIVQAIEPEVRFLDGVKHVRSTSVEGKATIAVEFQPGTDMQGALSDVETGVGQVTTLPEDSERPVIRRVVRYDTIAKLVVSGPYPEATLKSIAKRLRDGLLGSGIQKVDLAGARDEEIWVEIPPAALLRLDMTLGEVAERIGAISRDVPAGNLQGSSERQIRSLGLIRDAAGLAPVEVKALPGGESVRLGDIANLSEKFDEDGVQVRRGGGPAIELHVQRALSADALDQAELMNRYLAEVTPTLPPDVRVERHSVASDLIQDRVNLLLKNGIGGLILVIAILFAFLNSRVAFWVAVGIPVSLMATLFIMLTTGQTINMISLFGMIMAIGIVVDEAIVVGEHAEYRFRMGDAPLAAAETGAGRMAAPVLSSALTTIAAFIPLLVIGDIIGVIIAAIPLVVIAMIASSVLECFLILPAHLNGALKGVRKQPSGFRRRFDAAFDGFRDRFGGAVGMAIRWRYLVIAGSVGALILTFGLMQGGRVAFQFFPAPESDYLFANAEMVAGTPREDTVAMLDEIERAARAAERKLAGEEGRLLRIAVSRVGTNVGREGAISVSGDNVGGVQIELVPSDTRDVRTDEMIEAWRAEITPKPGLRSLAVFAAQGGPPGREIDVRLSGRNLGNLKNAAEEVKALLKRYPGVSDVEDDLPYGKGEEIIELTPHGRALGFTTESVAGQVRDAFQGAIARRFARGDEEVLIRVQYPRDEADSAALSNFYLRAPGGQEVALSQVVSRRAVRGFSRIQREDGLRQAAITGEIDEEVTSSDRVLAALERDDVADIVLGHGLQYRFAGKAEEQARTAHDMQTGAIIGVVTIYIVLAWVFASFSRPVVVMAVIPFSLIGAVLGHWILGFDLTILSIMALLGLAGIVVNDSIILVTVIDERLGRGEPLHEAIVEGTKDRLRAVILTTATTIGGLLPLMFETSFQAQFLIPMALTITFGLAVTSVLVLGLLPALVAVQGDFRAWMGRRAASEPATEAEHG